MFDKHAGEDSNGLIALAKSHKPLVATGLASGALGTLAGLGASKLTSPSMHSIKNLQKEELLEQYRRAIDEVNGRVAIRKARSQNI